MAGSADDAKDVSLGHTPGARWMFDEAVARVFGDMLRRSIPDYDGMRASVLEVGSAFVRPRTDVVDVGCSRGDALEPFVRRFGCHNRFVGLERSEAMLKAARERFGGYLDAGTVDLRKHDLRDPYPMLASSLTLCVLTLQFLTIPHRRDVLHAIHSRTLPGGAVVLVEKVLGESKRSDDLLVGLYHAMKEANGYSREEIERKRRSLEGVMAPATASQNRSLLEDAGFVDVECFWRRLNFAGFVAVKRA